ncbi:MAG: NAD(P)H-hydrate epimerase [Myxococcota bacterium]
MAGVETIPRFAGAIPWLTTEQMVEVDRAMIEDYRIELIQMMENAGRALAQVARARFLGGSPEGRRVRVLAGPGGNGGGAMVSARRLAAWGAEVEVFLSADENRITPVPQHQLDILRRMTLPVRKATEDRPEDVDLDLILDGIIGYSLKGAPRGPAKTLIEWTNSQTSPVLSLDAPSGVDTTTGHVYTPAIEATATMTLALPKEGLRGPGINTHVGELYLADISVPPSLYAAPALGLSVPATLFASSDVVRLT